MVSLVCHRLTYPQKPLRFHLVLDGFFIFLLIPVARPTLGALTGMLQLALPLVPTLVTLVDILNYGFNSAHVREHSTSDKRCQYPPGTSFSPSSQNLAGQRG
jgi:hypothetical protein